MTIEELEIQFQELKIDPRYYKFKYDKSLDDCMCMTESLNGWEVYYVERGEKCDIAYFKYEFQACDYVFGTILRHFKNDISITRID